MHIVADENIPFVDELMGDWGRITRRPGRQLRREDLLEADILLVRSVTPVNRALLEGTPVRFVGTCTIGTDHLDLDWLQAAGIQWAAAPGCNARGVVDYVLGALLALEEVSGCRLDERCYGIVGVGEVGGRLARVLQGLGWAVLLCDPLRAEVEGDQDFVPLETILQRCDVISLHVPLIRTGPWATRGLLNRQRLQQLKPGAWLINSCRGDVLETDALLQLLEQRPDLELVLDVWEGEPQIDPLLIRHCRIATPHIAGYSLDGKARGTLQVHEALCRFLGRQPGLTVGDLLPAPVIEALSVSTAATPELLLRRLCRAVYDPREDDAALRRVAALADAGLRAEGFDRLRKNYPVRREIDGLQVRLAPGCTSVVRQTVKALGCRCSD